MLQFQVGIIGGGLAGLCSAIHLAKSGISCVVFEKGEYPRHKVCGEYVSRETLGYLSYLGFKPYDLGAVDIHSLQVSHWNGNHAETTLDMGAFGISRYVFDHALYQLALKAGVIIHLSCQVNDIQKLPEGFILKTSNQGEVSCELVISAHGKKSNVDRILDRPFFKKDNDYLGVKYHIEFEVPTPVVYLHNFEHGYCGVSKVENNITNVCYLTTKTSLKKYGEIEELEKSVLHKNPYLKDIFTNGKKLFSSPKTISDFSFRPKSPVENGMLMAGDAAGLITPLCGNGMAMAIHAAYLAVTCIKDYYEQHHNRVTLEVNYARIWKQTFESRLWYGYRIQNLFGKKLISSVSLRAMKLIPSVLPALVKKTHGIDFFKP